MTKDDCNCNCNCNFDLGDLMYDILDNFSESIMVLDREYKIVYANKKLLETGGYGKKDVIGSHCYKITHDRDDICTPPDHKCPIAEYIEKGNSETFIHKHKDKDGKEFFTEVSAYPIRDEQGDVVGFIHVSRDLSSDVIRAIRNIKEVDEAGGDTSALKEEIKKAGL